MEKLELYRYKLNIEYDGTSYCGFQMQYEEGLKTIEGELLRSITNFANYSTKITASGRTDAGVHAICQTINFDLPKKYDQYQMIMGLNFYLKEENICVLSAELVDNNFSARFDAKMRYYRYIILNRKAPAILDKNRLWHIGGKKLDIQAMQKAGNYLLGEHDFSAFRDAQCQAKSPIKTIEAIKIFEDSNEKIIIEISAKSFLHHMVRNIVGTLYWVGSGKINEQEIIKILQSKDRAKSGPNAPACGLYFLASDY